MVRRHIIPIALFVFAVLLWWTYESTRPIPGVEGKGDVSDWIPWVSLAGSITSLLTGMVTLSPDHAPRGAFFATSAAWPRAIVPSGQVGVRQLAMQRVWS